MTIKLGSLFDGAGTCPLAATILGIEPVWASEIEPFPIKVTQSRFPHMTHLGDVTKVNGGDIEPVDIITFGSPCQNMSVAGKREGLEGKQSILFMDAIRIIKEMRNKTNGKYPRFAMWENVPGAYSSNKGEDFKIVLAEFVKIKEEGCIIPRPPKGKWQQSGLIMGDGYSIAWRTLDAQFWGVPQRRRRIFLVADFGGQCAGEILFESEGLSRNFKESRKAWEGIAKNAERSVRTTGGGNDIVSTLYAAYGTKWNGNAGAYNGDNFVIDNHESMGNSSGFDSYNQVIYDECSQTLKAHSGGDSVAKVVVAGFQGKAGAEASLCYGENISPSLVQSKEAMVCYGVNQNIISIEPGALKRGQGERIWDKCPTLRANMGDNQPCVVLNDQGGSQMSISEEVTATLRAQEHGHQPLVIQQDSKVYSLDSVSSNSMKSKNPHSGFHETEIARCLDISSKDPTCNQGGNIVVFNEETITSKTNASNPQVNDPCHTLGASGAGRTILVKPQENAVCLQGSMIGREDKNGPQGNGINDNLSFTLNVTDRHAVAYAMQRSDELIESEVASTQSARQFKSATDLVVDKNAIAYGGSSFAQYEENQVSTIKASGGDLGGGSETLIKQNYIVRRLTPTECAKLQGMPSWWCSNIAIENPTEEDIVFWLDRFNTYCKINETKPKNRKQIISWLKNPYSDTAEYKMWGNGMALPCVLFVIDGIKRQIEK